VQSGVPLFLQGYFHSHSGATDFLKYYIQWYKTAADPQIHSDSLYWAYRTQSKATTASTNIPPIGTVYGRLADEVYISANLKAPAQLKVNAGNGVQTLNQGRFPVPSKHICLARSSLCGCGHSVSVD
jgi:hypothetical protein